MSDSCYIRLSTDGTYWFADVMINGKVFASGDAKITKEDKRSDGAAVTVALHNFHQEIGKDIRRMT